MTSFTTIIQRVFALSLLWLWTAISWGGSGDLSSSKLSSYLTYLLSQRRAALAACPPSVAMADGQYRPLCSGQSSPQVMAFVQTDGSFEDEVFSSHGARCCCRVGDIAVALLPIDALPSLATREDVRRIEARATGKVLMDTTRMIVNATPAYQSSMSPHPFTGKGVVVGVMDVGFDFTHPTFLDMETGRSRVGAFWDQLSLDTVGTSLPVGADYVGEQKVLDYAHSRDAMLISHGTHTLGIAAGGGYDSPYRGVAYESELCVVANAVNTDLPLIDSTDIYRYTTATDALGFKYIFDYAERRSAPCVISFSEGYHEQWDDEDLLYAEFLSRLVGPGRIIVTSAGNESVVPTYLGKPSSLYQVGAQLMGGEKQGVMHFFADGPFEFLLSVGEGATTSTVVFSSSSLENDTLWCDTLWTHDRHRYLALQALRRPSLPFCQLSLQSNDYLYNLSHLRLLLRSTSTVSALCSSSSFFFVNIEEGWDGATATHNILAPGCFPSVITVGSTIHRTGFYNYLNEYKDYTQEGRNDGVLATYSSVGPTLDGRLKPEVVAPGNNIISSYSSFYLAANPQASDIQSDIAHFDYNGRTYAWNANTGTSMATPVVAGGIALWLQAKPDLTPEEVVELLQLTSRHPEQELTYPNNEYGYGEMDIYAGLLRLLGVDAIEGVTAQAPHAITFSRMDNNTVRLSAASSFTAPLCVGLYDMQGRQLHTYHLSAGDHSEHILTLPTLSSALYLLSVSSPQSGYNGVFVFRY